jgi:hypothetical protein
MNLKQIIDAILKLAEKEKHPDKVTCIHTVLMQVNILTGKEMERIRDDERK